MSHLRAGLQVVVGRASTCTTFGGRNLAHVMTKLWILLRRGDAPKAFEAALDLLLTSLSGCTRRHVAVFTHLCQGLMVFAVEEVGVAAPQVVLEVDFFVTKACKAAKGAKSCRQVTVPHLKAIATPLLACVQLLCAAPTLRLVSDVRAFAALPPLPAQATQTSAASGTAMPVVRPRYRDLLRVLRQIHGLPRAPDPQEQRPFATVLEALRVMLATVPMDATFPLRVDSGEAWAGDDVAARLAKLQLEGLDALAHALGVARCRPTSIAFRNLLLAQVDTILRVLAAVLPVVTREVIVALRSWVSRVQHPNRPACLVLAFLLASRATPATANAPLPANVFGVPQLERLVLATQDEGVPVSSLFQPLDDDDGAPVRDVVEHDQARALRDMHADLRRLLENRIMQRTHPITCESVACGVATAAKSALAVDHILLSASPVPSSLVTTANTRASRRGRGCCWADEGDTARMARMWKRRRVASQAQPRAPLLATADVLEAQVSQERWDQAEIEVWAKDFPQQAALPMSGDVAERLCRPRARLVAQCCTARFKPPVYILGATSAQGPFHATSAVPQRVVDRVASMMAWGAAATVLPCFIHTHPTTCEQFLVFPTIGAVPPMCQDLVFHRWSTPPKRGFVAASDGARPSPTQVLSHRLLAMGAGALSSQQWLHVFQHLLLCFVLGCGDVGLRNFSVDVRTGRVWSTDLDARRRAAPCATVWQACFPKRCARDTLVPVVVKALREHQQALYRWTMERWVHAQTSARVPSAAQAKRWMALLGLMNCQRWFHDSVDVGGEEEGEIVSVDAADAPASASVVWA